MSTHPFTDHCGDCAVCRAVMEAYFGEMPLPHRLCPVGLGILEGMTGLPLMVYKCEVCGGEYRAGNTEAEALGMAQRDFGTTRRSELVKACESCYEKVMAWNKKNQEGN